MSVTGDLRRRGSIAHFSSNEPQMKPERLNTIDQLFQSALDLAPEQRHAFLDQRCEGDAQLRHEVESLLAAHDQAGDFIEDSASDIAARLLAESSKEGPLVGASVGPYKIVGHLGTGGMGEVYLATDKMGRKVALKLLTARLGNDQQGVARFLREAQAVLSLNHPNIVTVYDIGRADSTHYIASELIEGQSLGERLKLERDMGVPEALDIAIQVASALAAAHEKGIIHRDIKPDNIMLRPDGYVKVVDFGIAKLLEGEAPPPTATGVPTKTLIKTSEGVAIGTIHYMSPEQARGLLVDVRTDTWSLGVVLYEMIAGRQPFAGDTVADVLNAVIERQPPPLLRYARAVPEALEWIVTKALRKEKEGRYQTAIELLTDLKELRKRLEFAAEQERSGALKLPGETQATAIVNPAIPGTANLLAERTAGVSERNTSSAEYIAGRINHYWRAIIIVAALMIVAAASAYLYLGRTNRRTISSIAVLPLVNASGDPNMEYLSDGISESLINSLSRVSALRVMARNTVFRYKGRETDPQTVGRELGVDAVLTGRVVQRGDTLIVQSDLVSVADGSQLWGEQFNRKASDILVLQDDISREIAEKLRLPLSNEEQQQLTKRYTEDVEAYQLYLKGSYFWEKQLPADAQKGIDYFQQAIARDPKYALAYSGLAAAYVTLPLTGDIAPGDAFQKARVAVTRALEIDPTLGEAHASAAGVKFWDDWDWEGAERELKRALELSPNYSGAHRFYGYVLFTLGRPAEALKEIRIALDLDPLSPLNNARMGQFFYGGRQFDAAMEQLRKTVELEPGFWLGHLYLGMVYERKGRYAEALAEIQKARELSHDNTDTLSLAGYTYAVSESRDQAQKTLDELKSMSSNKYVPPYNVAMIYLGFGDKDRAFEWLNKAYGGRDVRLRLLKVEPKWDSIRSDPRFGDLMRRLGFQP